MQVSGTGTSQHPCAWRYRACAIQFLLDFLRGYQDANFEVALVLLERVVTSTSIAKPGTVRQQKPKSRS
jgi:hypothetical protein